MCLSGPKRPFGGPKTDQILNFGPKKVCFEFGELNIAKLIYYLVLFILASLIPNLVPLVHELLRAWLHTCKNLLQAAADARRHQLVSSWGIHPLRSLYSALFPDIKSLHLALSPSTVHVYSHQGHPGKQQLFFLPPVSSCCSTVGPTVGVLTICHD